MKRILFVAMLATGCNKGIEFAGPTADKANPVILSDEEFLASQINDEKISYVPAFGLVEEEVTLKEKPPVLSTLRQQERPVEVDAYKQGSDGELAEEEFSISTAGKVDLVVVVDDSSSMSDEQTNLAPNLGALTKYLKSTDWQIGVVTTTVKAGDDDFGKDLPCKLQNARAPGMPIKKSDLDPAKNFFDTVNELGIKGSGHERGIKQAMRVVDDKCGEKWLRDDAALAVFFISDEQGYCRNNLCPEKDDTSDILKLLRAKRSDDKLKAYALIWNMDAKDPVFAKCKTGGGASYGQRYADVVKALGGIKGSICLDDDPATNDYEAILEQISKDVARNVKYEFPLKHQPAAGATIVATVDGQPYTAFEIVGSMLKLKDVAGDSVNLKVSYRYDATPKTDRFALKNKGAVETVQVFVNGQAVDPSRLTFDEVTNEVVLTDLPPDDAEVKLKYRKEGVLPSILDLARFLMNGLPLGVWVNGAPASNFEFDPATGVISFKDAPGDGAEIKVSHRVPGDKTLNYVSGWANAKDRVQEVVAKDAATGASVNLTIDQGELVFDDQDVVEGRKIIVSYDFGSAKDTLTHELMHQPLEGSLEVKTAAGKDGCITDVRVDEQTVSYSCDGDELGPVTISYQYVMARYTEFEVSEPVPDGAFVQVYVDRSAILDFTRSGQKVMIPENELKLDSTVRIIVTAGS